MVASLFTDGDTMALEFRSRFRSFEWWKKVIGGCGERKREEA